MSDLKTNSKIVEPLMRLDSEVKMINRISELESCLRSMISAIDLIWREQGFTQDKEKCICNYARSKKLLSKDGE